MPTAYQHRPMSKILAPAEDPTAKPTSDTPGEQVATSQTESLPEKYQGKTVAEVADMHLNAEKELGRVRNELGTYRGLVSDLSAIQRAPAASQPAEQEEVDVSGDDLIQSPVETVRKIVKQDFDNLKAENDAAAMATQVDTEVRALSAEFGDFDSTVGTDEFKDFSNRTPTRHADLVSAATGEGLTQVRAARRLLEDFADFKKHSGADKKTELTPTDIARQVATEGSGPAGSVSSKPKIYESDVISLINSDVAKYRSPSYQAELTAAIKEGRFVKND